MKRFAAVWRRLYGANGVALLIVGAFCWIELIIQWLA